MTSAGRINARAELETHTDALYAKLDAESEFRVTKYWFLSVTKY
ncbi:hypothetical protein FACS189472_15620 [Alphaproteobacteria bacterium]|nr:hypothetical protein FACS189472_15620 [Alphaproteobacteria bacterium]